MRPVNNFVGPLLTDMYEVTMAYAYFKSNRHEDHAAFDLFFRTNPFGGEFTIFAGLTEVLAFVQNYHFTDEDIEYICKSTPKCDQDFQDWLKGLDCSKVKIYALREGDLCFPRVPLLRVEGPLGICQLLETTLVNLVSFPSLIATNAARMNLVTRDDQKLVEFGLRRAQGPDGGISASRYSYLGGFDGTSNMLAGKLFDIPVSGTQAHAFISSYAGLDDLETEMLVDTDENERNFVKKALEYREKIGTGNGNDGELAAFIAYAQAYPTGLVALVDTYDTLKSGVPNFLAVAMALKDFGYEAVGLRLDSGDLAYLSKQARQKIRDVEKKLGVDLSGVKIVASSEINEDTLDSLKKQGNEIDIFGVGTHLVTCQAQPALGCVYKIVEVNDEPKIKLSQEAAKINLPGRKHVFRLYGKEGCPLADVMVGINEEKPQVGKKFLCCHPFEIVKRTYITPSRVEQINKLVWDGKINVDLPSLNESREFAQEQLKSLREDHKRRLNPTPYKVSLSEKLFDKMQELWTHQIPPGELE